MRPARPGGKTALVLAGGAARGAYEVGVVSHILDEVSRDLGRDVPIDVLCGTSVGAINVCALAAFADQPRGRGARLAAHWTSLQMSDVVRPDARGIFDSVRALFGRSRRPGAHESRRGGILDSTGIERVIERAIPFARIGENIRAGHLDAVTVSATHVGTGRTTVFAQQGRRGPHYTSKDPTLVGAPTILTREHALASAAIPFLFPAVRVDGEFYCDGGLRQNVPLAPALRLGADRLIIVSPRYLPPVVTRTVAKEREDDFPGPFFLLGKALNSLLLDRVDNDLDRLQAINELLEVGERSYGATFTNTINRELAQAGRDHRIRPVRATLVRASQDIGAICADYVRSSRFAARVGGIALGMMRRIADTSGEADLLSYLLFDGEFAARMIELGRADARARHQELCGLFAEVLEERLAA
jgi:NTE family protein